MLKKENLRKNFLRVKQIADQNLGRCGLCILYTYIQYCLVFTCYRNHIALSRTHLLYCMYMHGNFYVVAKPFTLIIIYYSEIIKYGCTVDRIFSMICRKFRHEICAQSDRKFIFSICSIPVKTHVYLLKDQINNSLRMINTLQSSR